jgi:hypothetical protein
MGEGWTNAINLIREITTALANPQVVLGIMLLSVMVFQTGMLMRASRDSRRNFDLLDALIDRATGRVGARYLVQMACLEVGLWVLVLYAIQGKMTDWMFAIVMFTGVGVPIANKIAEAWASKIAAAAPTPPQPSSVTATMEIKQ